MADNFNLRSFLTENKLTKNAKLLKEAREEGDAEAPFGRNKLTGEPLPDPASQMVAEDDMVQEKSLPKYESIDKLMQEIEHGTNEAAYKHKMAKMKEVAEMLEAKVGSLEEGEGADFVDAKKVKQMKKDIMTLRKQAEKLEKEYEKKFAKKETKVELKETKMEKQFDLRKFLTENKLTNNPKAVNEYGAPTGLVDAAEEFLDNSGMDPQGQLDAVEELALWCTGKIAQLENELEG